MAKAVQVHKITVLADGKVQVDYNAGPSPLPTEWQGSSLVYNSKQELANALQAAEESMSTETLVLIAVASGWTKSDPSMSNPTSAKLTEAQLDLTGAASAIKVK